MTLAYENDSSTIDWVSEVVNTSSPVWVDRVSDRQDKARSSSLAALAGMPISSRFCSWIGLSGQRYVFSVYSPSECPAFRDAVLVAAIRDMTGQQRVVSVRETGSFPEPVMAKAQRDLRAFGPGLEFHLYLLAASAAERAATVADLAIVRA
jgi:hypothetical protein